MEMATDIDRSRRATLVSWRHIVVVGVVMLIVPAMVIIGLSRSLPEGLTRESAANVQIGMKRDALHRLLGEPDQQFIQVGRVDDDTTFVTNASLSAAELKAAGHRKYIFEQWVTRQFTLIVIIDSGDEVVCQYRSGGQRRSPFAFMHKSARVTLPPENPDATEPAAPLSSNQ